MDERDLALAALKSQIQQLRYAQNILMQDLEFLSMSMPAAAQEMLASKRVYYMGNVIQYVSGDYLLNGTPVSLQILVESSQDEDFITAIHRLAGPKRA